MPVKRIREGGRWMAVAGRRPLSRRRVLEAAVRFADREGLGSLTMRRLGAELGVEAMSLYNHVPNKGALLDGMVEVLLGELDVPPEDEGWERRIREAYRAFRRLAHEHPNVFPLLVVRPPDTMDGIWLVEEFLKTLRGQASIRRRGCTPSARSPATLPAT